MKIVLFGDTHLGIDWPLRPRIERRRRGDDFYNNYLSVIHRAEKEAADLVIHGGDLFFRSRIPQWLVVKAFDPLIGLADRGIQVLLIPGNHERSQIPLSLFAKHPNLHIFDKPKTIIHRVDQRRIGFSGFPFCRENPRDRFPELLQSTLWQETEADIRFLCIHQAIEGATVGPKNFQFLRGADVVRTRDIPDEFTAILSGHIHRFQVLRKDPRGKALTTPVFFPGSLERTSIAEADEPKGFLLLDISSSLLHYEFIELPARPMVEIKIPFETIGPGDGIIQYLREQIGTLDPNSIVRVKVEKKLTDLPINLPGNVLLRSIAPPTMNIELVLPRSSPPRHPLHS